MRSISSQMLYNIFFYFYVCYVKTVMQEIYVYEQEQEQVYQTTFFLIQMKKYTNNKKSDSFSSFPSIESCVFQPDLPSIIHSFFFLFQCSVPVTVNQNFIVHITEYIVCCLCFYAFN